ncbi:MAG TPA: NAD-dependent epimerase/dehydratase family protein [Burkholderiales bacterium]|nr:NAD-dependent epimerase/dehydratase family protein [Burkholderiales bacterium]
MRVHVTGASGFIGSHLCPALAAAGHDVRPALEGCDAVVHLANIAHTSAPPAELHRVNVEGTIAQAKATLAAGARRFVYLSSIKADKPDDPYGRAKSIAEQALLQLAGLEPAILRPPLVYGPRVKANFLALMRAVDRGWPLPLASIRNRRSLVYVGNLVDAILRCLEGNRVGRTYAVSDGAPVSTPELCRALGRALGRPARLWPFPSVLLRLAPGFARLTESLEVDDRAIRDELGWRAPFSFEQGLQATAQWYRAQGG